MKRITNVDTISALIDRLITENIKLYFFQKNEETDSIIHQRDPFWKVAVNDYDSPIFNVGGDKDFSLNEVAKMLIEISGKSNAKIIHLQPRHEVKTAFCDHTKAKNILGFVDKTPLNKMLIEMWNWAIKQPNRPVKSWDKYELNEGIYDFWK